MFKSLRRNITIFRKCPEIRTNILRSYLWFVPGYIFNTLVFITLLPLMLVMLIGAVFGEFLDWVADNILRPINSFTYTRSQRAIHESRSKLTQDEVRLRAFGETPGRILTQRSPRPRINPNWDKAGNLPPKRRSLNELMEESQRRMAAMTPAERKEMFRAQRESFTRGQLAMGSDRDEAEYRSRMLL